MPILITKTYEYKIVSLSPSDVSGTEAAMTALGEEGWEFVPMSTDTYGRWSTSFFFRRETQHVTIT